MSRTPPGFENVQSRGRSPRGTPAGRGRPARGADGVPNGTGHAGRKGTRPRRSGKNNDEPLRVRFRHPARLFGAQFRRSTDAVKHQHDRQRNLGVNGGRGVDQRASLDAAGAYGDWLQLRPHPVRFGKGESRAAKESN